MTESNPTQTLLQMFCPNPARPNSVLPKHIFYLPQDDRKPSISSPVTDAFSGKPAFRPVRKSNYVFSVTSSIKRNVLLILIALGAANPAFCPGFEVSISKTPP